MLVCGWDGAIAGLDSGTVGAVCSALMTAMRSQVCACLECPRVPVFHGFTPSPPRCAGPVLPGDGAGRGAAGGGAAAPGAAGVLTGVRRAQVRAARKAPALAAWGRAHAGEVLWLAEWLDENPRAPAVAAYSGCGAVCARARGVAHK